MGGADVLLPCQVGDGAGDLEHAVIGPSAEPELRHRRLQELLGIGANLAEFLHLARSHLGVGVDFPILEPLELPVAGPNDPLSNPVRALAVLAGDDVLELDLGDIDLDVDPVKERPRDLGVIFLPLRVRAVGVSPRKPPEHVLTGVRCQVAI